jgi:hypothetical protein
MAHRNLGKLVAAASTILLLAVSTAALAVLYVSPPAANDVEVTSARHTRDGREARARSRWSTRWSSGDGHRQSRRYVTDDTVKESTQATSPTTEVESTPTTQDGGSSDETEGDNGRTAGGSTTTCPLPAYPSADCTGVPAGTNLMVHNGDLIIDRANTVIDSQDIHGCVSVKAPGVVIRRSKITCSSFLAVGSRADYYSGVGVVLEDVEISCANTLGSSGVGDYNATVRRANIHSCEHGTAIDGRMIVEHSYIHDLIRYNPATDPHVDGSIITPVGNGITLWHNTIYAGDGSSGIISPKVSDGVVSDVLIKDNLMAGGTYSLYCQQNGPGNNYRVINNRFSTVQYPSVGIYGPWVECEDEAQVTGNVYHETGRPVPL